MSQYSKVIKDMIIERHELSNLLMFIKNNENVSKEQVVDYMDKGGYASRVTTLNMINALHQEGVIDIEKRKNYLTSLKINPNFDFYSLLIESFWHHFKEVKFTFEPYLTGLLKDKKELDKFDAIFRYLQSDLKKKEK